MIQLVLGKIVESHIAKCNWCGEGDKQCAKAVLPEKLSVCYTEDDHELKWLRSDKIFSAPHAYWIRSKSELETKSVERFANICKDCASQLAKLL